MRRFRRFLIGVAALFVILSIPGSSYAVDYRVNFIHRSTGGNWLLEGGLRVDLQNLGFTVHESHGIDAIPCDTSTCNYPNVDNRTDPCYWLQWFTNYMEGLRSWECTPPDKNEIIMFKPCFPNSNITGEGTPPGDPENCERTVWNYKATFNALLPIFQAHPDVLFIAVTAPPRSDRVCGGSPCSSADEAARARAFNNWLKNDWLPPEVTNVAVFDFFDVLTKHGVSGDFLHPDYYWAGEAVDDHANATGLQDSSHEFTPFLLNAISVWESGIPATVGFWQLM